MREVPGTDVGGSPSVVSNSPAPEVGHSSGQVEHLDTVVMDMLAGRLPLCLIMDLVMPAGPHSAELLQAEGAPDEAWWEPR